MKYARSVNGVVTSVLRVPPSTIWGEEIAALYRPTEKAEIGWLDDGKTFKEPPPAVSRVPESVEAWQAKRALLAAGRYKDVEGAITSLGDDQESLAVKVDWASAKTFRRDWPALVALASQLGMDSDGLDALFVHAATL